jgi:hypothetical protein
MAGGSLATTFAALTGRGIFPMVVAAAPAEPIADFFAAARLLIMASAFTLAAIQPHHQTADY